MSFWRLGSRHTWGKQTTSTTTHSLFAAGLSNKEREQTKEDQTYGFEAKAAGRGSKLGCAVLNGAAETRNNHRDHDPQQHRHRYREQRSSRYSSEASLPAANCCDDREKAWKSCMTSCRMSPICVPALSASISLTACIQNTPPFLLSLTEPKQSAARAASGTSHLRNPCRADQACTGHGCLCPSTSTYSNVQTHECMRACMHACMHACTTAFMSTRAAAGCGL